MTSGSSVNAFAYLSDYVALGGVKYLPEHGHVVGQDAMVRGFDNIHAVRTHVLPMSSAEHVIHGIGDYLVEDMLAKQPKACPPFLSTKLIIRS